MQVIIEFQSIKKPRGSIIQHIIGRRIDFVVNHKNQALLSSNHLQHTLVSPLTSTCHGIVEPITHEKAMLFSYRIVLN